MFNCTFKKKQKKQNRTKQKDYNCVWSFWLCHQMWLREPSVGRVVIQNLWATIWDESQQHLLQMMTAALSHQLLPLTLLKILSGDSSRNIIYIYFFLKKRISLLQTPLWAKSKSTARRNNDISPLDGTLISEKAGGLAFTPADAGWQRALWWRRWKISTLGHSHIEIENKLQTASDVKSRGTSRNHQSGSNFGLFFFG